MTTVKDIEKAVSHLPRSDLARFRSWFEKFDANAWDEQFEEDALSGKLNQLADRALEDLANKRCVEL
ncbi:MAG: hypothetical protein WC340_07375 [Kiritimatiellia bacterium]|jgi:hypothetical protein